MTPSGQARNDISNVKHSRSSKDLHWCCHLTSVSLREAEPSPPRSERRGTDGNRRNQNAIAMVI